MAKYEEFNRKNEEVKTRSDTIPYLITRMGAGLLDLFMIFLFFIVLQTAAFYTLYEPLGYHDALNTAQNVLLDSGLYIVDENNNFLTLVEEYSYDEEEVDSEIVFLEQYYDVPITKFYAENSEAITANKYDTYLSAKANSTLFILEDGVYVVKEAAEISELKNFYELHYKSALAFLDKTPLYVINARKVFIISVFSNLGAASLSFSVFYLLIPLFSKYQQTIAQRQFKIGLIDTATSTRASRKQTLLRFIVLIAFNLWVPFLIYARFAYFTVIPVLITLVTIVATKNKQSVHEYASKTMLVSVREQSIPPRKVVIEHGPMMPY